MGASLFLLINLFIVIFLVSRIMKMGASRTRPSLKDEESPQFQRKTQEFFDIFTGARPQEKILNCPFSFEGSNYDAFEVLGVPAGAPKAVWQAAFKDLSRTQNPSQKRVLEAAIKALESHRFS